MDPFLTAHPDRAASARGAVELVPRARLRGFRTLCFVCAALLPAFWLAYHGATPATVDPLWIRLVLAGALLAIGGWTFAEPWPLRRFLVVAVPLPHVFCAWWIGLTYANAFAPNYALGTLFVFVAAGLALGVVTDRPQVFLVYSALVVATAAVAVSMTDRPPIDPYVLLACLGGEAVVMAVVQAARARATAELREAKEAAEEMARLKSAFLANMSHEIRTPLTAIIGFAQVLADEAEGEHNEFAQLIEKGGRRLLDTLNSVLDLARLQSGGFEMEIEALDVAQEARDLADGLRPLAVQKGLLLAVHAPVRGVVAYADRSALHRVLTNLVGNAIKFTGEGRIVLSVRARGTHVRVQVADTGRGMAPEFLPKLFTEFKQESEGHARSHEGTGLGLAITKQLVELMGGAIAVESVPGAGSTFTVTLPRGDAAPKRPAVDAEAVLLPI